MRDGSDTHVAEQVSIEADRLSGVVQDGVEAAEAASKSYGNLLADAYARMIQASMRSSAEMGDHLLSLLHVKTPADAFRMNLEFMQKQVLSSQGQFYDLIGMGRSAGAGKSQTGGRGA